MVFVIISLEIIDLASLDKINECLIQMNNRLEKIEMRLSLMENISLPTTVRKFIGKPIDTMVDVHTYEEQLIDGDVYKEFVSEHEFLIFLKGMSVSIYWWC